MAASSHNDPTATPIVMLASNTSVLSLIPLRVTVTSVLLIIRRQAQRSRAAVTQGFAGVHIQGNHATTEGPDQQAAHLSSGAKPHSPRKIKTVLCLLCRKHPTPTGTEMALAAEGVSSCE